MYLQKIQEFHTNLERLMDEEFSNIIRKKEIENDQKRIL